MNLPLPGHFPQTGQLYLNEPITTHNVLAVAMANGNQRRLFSNRSCGVTKLKAKNAMPG